MRHRYNKSKRPKSYTKEVTKNTDRGIVKGREIGVKNYRYKYYITQWEDRDLTLGGVGENENKQKRHYR